MTEHSISQHNNVNQAKARGLIALLHDWAMMKTDYGSIKTDKPMEDPFSGLIVALETLEKILCNFKLDDTDKS